MRQAMWVLASHPHVFQNGLQPNRNPAHIRRPAYNKLVNADVNVLSRQLAAGRDPRSEGPLSMQL